MKKKLQRDIKWLTQCSHFIPLGKTFWFSGVFREYRMGTLAVIGFIVVNDLLQQLFYMKV